MTTALPPVQGDEDRRACGEIARSIRMTLNHRATAILHARDRGEDVSELEQRQKLGIAYERIFKTRAGGPDVDYEPQALGYERPQQ